MSETTIEQLINKTEQYGRDRLELYKLKILRELIRFFTNFTVYLIFISILFFVMLMLSFGIAILWGELTGKLSYGFFIMAGFYAVILIACFFLLHKCIKKPLANLMIKKVINKI